MTSGTKCWTQVENRSVAGCHSHCFYNDYIYRAQIAHACRWRINEELHRRFLLVLLLLLSFEQKTNLEIIEAVLATAVLTPKDSAQLIFSFELCQLLGLYHEKPAAQGTIQGVLR